MWTCGLVQHGTQSRSARGRLLQDEQETQNTTTKARCGRNRGERGIASTRSAQLVCIASYRIQPRSSDLVRRQRCKRRAMLERRNRSHRGRFDDDQACIGRPSQMRWYRTRMRREQVCAVQRSACAERKGGGAVAAGAQGRGAAVRAVVRARETVTRRAARETQTQRFASENRCTIPGSAHARLGLLAVVAATMSERW